MGPASDRRPEEYHTLAELLRVFDRCAIGSADFVMLALGVSSIERA
jgi:hypothetical protein